MAGTEPTPSPCREAGPSQVPASDVPLPWRGAVAFGLLALVGAMGPDITPSRYSPELSHYIPRYVLLALSIGFGLGAVRSRLRADKVFGIAVVVAGCGLVAYIAHACLEISGW